MCISMFIHVCVLGVHDREVMRRACVRGYEPNGGLTLSAYMTCICECVYVSVHKDDGRAVSQVINFLNAVTLEEMVRGMA